MKKVSKKQFAFILVAVCLVGLIGIGISYSYYLASISTSNNENKNSDISSATITKVVMDMQGKVSSDGAYPGHKAVKEVAVRGIGNDDAIPANATILVTPDLGDFAGDVTWKVYKSDTAITCSSTVHTDGGEFYEEATCNIPDSASLELEGSSDKAYKNIVVKPNTETKYYLVVEYVNKTDEDQSNQMGKSFNIDIGISEKITSTVDIVAKLDTSDACPKVKDNNKTVEIKEGSTEGIVCSAPDDYGISYYYRGNVQNNYINFAGYYWRILRMNGDGSIRIVYNGTMPRVNGDTSYIGISKFNDNYDDNKYLGYMYGDSGGISIKYLFKITKINKYYISKEYIFDESSKTFTLKNPETVGYEDLKKYRGYYTTMDASYNDSSFMYKIKGIEDGNPYVSLVTYSPNTASQTQSNVIDSTIKKYLDTWYEQNIKNTNYEKYLSDNVFCNNRVSTSSGTQGAGTEATNYEYMVPRLICSEQNDAFTVNDVKYGNGDLKYPIGLLTADEYYLAHGYFNNYSTEITFYLDGNMPVWTMSPVLFNNAARMDVYYHGISLDAATQEEEKRNYSWVDNENAVQPVLNIKAGVYLYGDGTMENPYRLSVN